MDKEELYEKVIELMERVRELEAIINDNLDDLDDMKKRLSDADAENRSLKEENDMLRNELSVYNELGVMEGGETAPLLTPMPLEAVEPPESAEIRKFVGRLLGNRFLREFLDEHELTTRECAELCGISQSEAARLARGYRCRNATFDKVVHGLGLTAEQATEFRKSLTRKQRGSTK